MPTKTFLGCPVRPTTPPPRVHVTGCGGVAVEGMQDHAGTHGHPWMECAQEVAPLPEGF